MNAILKTIMNNRCTGIYIGPQAVIATRGSYHRGLWRIDHIYSRLGVGETSAISMSSDILEAQLESLLSEPEMMTGRIQVSFDDTLIRFFIIPQQHKSDKEEQKGIIRWHAQKVLTNVNEYTFSTDLVKSGTGYQLYGAAIRRDYITTVERVAGGKNMLWTVADSVASFSWNHMDDELKREAGSLLRLSKYGWTLFCWDIDGILAMIKPGRWSVDESGTPLLKKGLVEAGRLMTTYLEQNPQAIISVVHVETGGMDIEPDQVAMILGVKTVSVRERLSHKAYLTNHPSDYMQEFIAAAEASVPR